MDSGRWIASDAATSPSEASELEEASSVHHLMGSLSGRGKGSHICPYGENCTKGGWRDGQGVIFERNSAFKAHLQKHDKAYKCDLPGCTNKSGFARPDQLRRHQDTVSHV